jgi:hypothetical protein
MKMKLWQVPLVVTEAAGSRIHSVIFEFFQTSDAHTARR